MSKKTDLAKLTKGKRPKKKKQRKNPVPPGLDPMALIAPIGFGLISMFLPAIFPIQFHRGRPMMAPPRIVWYCVACSLHLERADQERAGLECEQMFCPKCKAPMKLYGRHERPNPSGAIDVTFEPIAAAAPRLIESGSK